MLVSELAASLEESRDELQVVKRKNTALIKVSVCFASSIMMRMEFIMFIGHSEIQQRIGASFKF